MTLGEVLVLLEGRIERAGGVRPFAGALGVSPSYVTRVLRRVVSPSPRLLDAIGVAREPPCYSLKSEEVTQ